MMYEVCKQIRNFFPDIKNQITGKFTISNSTISPMPTMATDQWFLIEGSTFNDGCFNDLEDLTDEVFEGTITPMKVPSAFQELVSEIESYSSKYIETPFASESFGGYSYTKDTSNSNWVNAFSTRLNAWRKV